MSDQLKSADGWMDQPVPGFVGEPVDGVGRDIGIVCVYRSRFEIEQIFSDRRSV